MVHFHDHALIGSASKLPVSDATPILSFSPVKIPRSHHELDLQLRVTAPATGTSLPIILLSHGHGQSNYLSSLEGYAPLAEFWAARGAVVIQPTHLSSKSLSLPVNGETVSELFMESRALDMVTVLDHLDSIEAVVPFLQGGGRLDKNNVAVVGHSMGALTASILLGATNTDLRNGRRFAVSEPRIKAGVVLGALGSGGADLSENGKKMIPFFSPDFSNMRTPTLVVWGDEDISPHLTTRGADWHADPYALGPSPKTSLRIKGAQHMLGGVSGWDTAECGDEDPERLAAVQRLTWAYLQSKFMNDSSWEDAKAALGKIASLGEVEEK